MADDVVVTSKNTVLSDALNQRISQLVEAKLVLEGNEVLEETKRVLRMLNPKGHATGDLENKYLGVSVVKTNKQGLKSIRVGAVKEGQRMLYAEVLEVGRKPGKMPPVDVIKEWIQIKQIPPPQGVSLDQFAFMIARKIGKKGTLALAYMEKAIINYRAKHGTSAYVQNPNLNYRR